MTNVSALVKLAKLKASQWEQIGLDHPSYRDPELVAVLRDCAIALAAQQDAWQPIETAPKDGETVWLWYDNTRCLGHYEPASWLGDGKWFVKGGVRRKGDKFPDGVFATHVVGAEPTLWQPLPAPPQT